jgi:segregation and condensation protein A
VITTTGEQAASGWGNTRLAPIAFSWGVLYPPPLMSDESESENAAPATATQSEAVISLDEAERLRQGFVRAGNDDWWVEARGDFAESAVKGYLPTPESDRLKVNVPQFEGPLDLLLHLIDKHALDIVNIPIATITKHYLQMLDDLRALDLDIAGEFLVMAAQLAHMKSKMLLPKEERAADQQEEKEDPREALIRRLMEYQRFKAAAEDFAKMMWLGRDVFARAPDVKVFSPAEVSSDDPTGGLAPFDVVKLIETLDQIMRRTKKRIVHEVTLERLTVGQRINEVVDFAQEREHFTFRDLVLHFGGLTQGKRNIIVTFLSVLEMTKFKILRIHQAQEDGTIYISVMKKSFDEDTSSLVEAYGDERPSHDDEQNAVDDAPGIVDDEEDPSDVSGGEVV